MKYFILQKLTWYVKTLFIQFWIDRNCSKPDSYHVNNFPAIKTLLFFHESNYSIFCNYNLWFFPRISHFVFSIVIFISGQQFSISLFYFLCSVLNATFMILPSALDSGNMADLWIDCMITDFTMSEASIIQSQLVTKCSI